MPHGKEQVYVWECPLFDKWVNAEAEGYKFAELRNKTSYAKRLVAGAYMLVCKTGETAAKNACMVYAIAKLDDPPHRELDGNLDKYKDLVKTHYIDSYYEEDVLVIFGDKRHAICFSEVYKLRPEDVFHWKEVFAKKRASVGKDGQENAGYLGGIIEPVTGKGSKGEDGNDVIDRFTKEQADQILKPLIANAVQSGTFHRAAEKAEPAFNGGYVFDPSVKVAGKTLQWEPETLYGEVQYKENAGQKLAGQFHFQRNNKLLKMQDLFDLKKGDKVVVANDKQGYWKATIEKNCGPGDVAAQVRWPKGHTDWVPRHSIFERGAHTRNVGQTYRLNMLARCLNYETKTLSANFTCKDPQCKGKGEAKKDGGLFYVYTSREMVDHQNEVHIKDPSKAYQHRPAAAAAAAPY